MDAWPALGGINFSNVTIVDPQPAQKCRPFLSFLPVCTRTQCMPLEQLTGHVHIEGNGAGCSALPFVSAAPPHAHAKTPMIAPIRVILDGSSFNGLAFYLPEALQDR